MLKTNFLTNLGYNLIYYFGYIYTIFYRPTLLIVFRVC